MSTVDQIKRLCVERPDLIPLLRRLLDGLNDGNRGWVDDEDPDDMAELARRGLIVLVD